MRYKSNTVWGPRLHCEKSFSYSVFFLKIEIYLKCSVYLRRKTVILILLDFVKRHSKCLLWKQRFIIVPIWLLNLFLRMFRYFLLNNKTQKIINMTIVMMQVLILSEYNFFYLFWCSFIKYSTFWISFNWAHRLWMRFFGHYMWGVLQVYSELKYCQ